MGRTQSRALRGNRTRATKKEGTHRALKTGMRLWMVQLKEPRRYRERKVWVTDVIALATSSLGAEHAARRELPHLFTYNPSVHVEPFSGHAVKHLAYQTDPVGNE